MYKEKGVSQKKEQERSRCILVGVVEISADLAKGLRYQWKNLNKLSLPNKKTRLRRHKRTLVSLLPKGTRTKPLVQIMRLWQERGGSKEENK